MIFCRLRQLGLGRLHLRFGIFRLLFGSFGLLFCSCISTCIGLRCTPLLRIILRLCLLLLVLNPPSILGHVVLRFLAHVVRGNKRLHILTGWPGANGWRNWALMGRPRRKQVEWVNRVVLVRQVDFRVPSRPWDAFWFSIIRHSIQDRAIVVPLSRPRHRQVDTFLVVSGECMRDTHWSVPNVPIRIVVLEVLYNVSVVALQPKLVDYVVDVDAPLEDSSHGRPIGLRGPVSRPLPQVSSLIPTLG